ncbi:hypothetical protein BCR39DRAFT_515819 [Naematelia encephala]|uniref:Uncharacterized protein n=1 Tax=Naematelia encephala TaxID=71784 RepID=A0A1Y2BLG5_9TREE|nr:hypothetical protein BCR39DRAFT_515819 [Naematelia encephala]
MPFFLMIPIVMFVLIIVGATTNLIRRCHISGRMASFQRTQPVPQLPVDLIPHQETTEYNHLVVQPYPAPVYNPHPHSTHQSYPPSSLSRVPTSTASVLPQTITGPASRYEQSIGGRTLMISPASDRPPTYESAEG